MTDRDPSAGAAEDAGPRIRGRARSKAGEAADLRDADAERRAASKSWETSATPKPLRANRGSFAVKPAGGRIRKSANPRLSAAGARFR